MNLKILLILIFTSINLIYGAQKIDSADLINAAKTGNIENLKAAIQAKVDLNQPDKDGRTALWWAANDGNEEVVELLLSAGANANLVDNEGRNPLMVAAIRNFDSVVDLLLKNTNVNVRDLDGITALMIALENKNIDILKSLIDFKGINLNQQDKEGRTAAWRAAYEGDEQALLLLINAGSNLQLADNAGKTPLMAAVIRNFENIVKLILKLDKNINARDINGRTALIFAALTGNKDIIKLLLDHGARIFVKDQGGKDALDIAINQRNEKLKKDKSNLGTYPKILELFENKIDKESFNIRDLLKAGKIDLKAIKEYLANNDVILDFYINHHTPLIEAIALDNPELVAFFLKNKADPYFGDRADLKPLDAILLYNKTNMLKVFLDQLPDLKMDQKDLELAFIKGDPDILNLLFTRFKDQILKERKKLIPSLRDNLRQAIAAKDEQLTADLSKIANLFYEKEKN